LRTNLINKINAKSNRSLKNKLLNICKFQSAVLESVLLVKVNRLFLIENVIVFKL